jgi:hypothetical protein
VRLNQDNNVMVTPPQSRDSRTAIGDLIRLTTVQDGQCNEQAAR